MLKAALKSLPLAFIPCGLLLFITACSGGSGGSGFTEVPPEPAVGTLRAEVRFTEYGIPHVSATDWSSLGYGHGYAYASQNYCVMMREIVISNGQSQRYFGEEGNLANDFVFALLGDDIDAAYLDMLDVDSLAVAEGYVAGFNRYLADTGVDALPAGDSGCQGAAWVRDITLQDYGKMLRKLTVRASTDPLARFIYASNGPNQIVAKADKGGLQLASVDREAIRQGIAAIDLPKPEQLGSNAYAVGSSLSQDGSGMLFGNPHFPWQGSNRFSMVHLTMTPEGAEVPEFDVMGAALHGFPLISIGFNKDLAWSHTVSTGSRFVLHELTLNPADPMQYEFDGAMRDITTKTISIETQSDSGAIVEQSHTFYFSHFGPILDLGGVNALLAGWPVAAGTGTVYALRDINVDNVRGLETWRGLGQAASISELETAISNLGIPWVNTIAADRDGTAFYGDISAVANVTDAQAETCIGGLIAPLLTGFGLTTLDGTTSGCELGTDDDAPVAGIIGYARLPKLINNTYVANSNDSYWLSNPDNLLAGYPNIIGEEQVEQSLRTRLAFMQMEERLAGTDGLGAAGVTPALLQDMFFGSRNLAAELVMNDVVALCNSVADWSAYSPSPAAVIQACGVLAAWDTRHNNDSVGGHIFFEFWRIARDIDDLWLVEFDPADPVNTPNTLNAGNAEVTEDLKQALADGVQVLIDNNIALNAAWGDVQYAERNGQKIPIHGGSSGMLFSVVTSDLVADEGYTDIVHGNSYMQTVGWDSTDCPDASALLSYSQSSDPASPNYADQTLLYSNKQWVDMPFCEADISAALQGDAMTIEETVPQ